MLDIDMHRETEIAYDSGFGQGVDYARKFMKDEYKNMLPNQLHESYKTL